MTLKHRLLILVTVLFYNTVALAQDDVPTLFIDGQLQEINLTYYSQLLLDESATLTFKQLQQNKTSFQSVLDPQQLHLGYYSGAVWLRHVITNTSDQPVLKILSFDYANLDRVNLYVMNSSGELLTDRVSGSHIKRSERAIQNRHASFPINIPPHSSVILLSRITTNGSMTAYHHLYSAEAYDKNYSQELLWLSVYCGMLLALGLYNMLLYAALRESVFIRYALFVISFLFGTLAMNGLGVQFFWDHDTLNVNRVMAFSFSAAGFMGTLFVREFLALRQNSPGWHNVTYIPLTVSALGMLSAFFASPQTALEMADINGLSAGLILLTCGISCLIKRVPGARLFVIAWSLLLSGAFIHALRNLGIFPTNFFSLYGMQIGSAIEMLLLSFAIATKFNQLKQAKQRAQNEALTLLRTNETKLEQQIEQRTYELQQMANHDGLTGLLNRNGLHQALHAAISRCERNQQLMTLLMLDLDGFKPINDEYGHYVGDRVLEVVAKRLQQCVRGYDTAARFGGDEFLVISESLSDEADAHAFCQRISEQIAQPMSVGVSQELTISASIGFYQSTAATSVNHLLKEADKAMYRVKYQQRGKHFRH